jgi:hypothetical protein
MVQRLENNKLIVKLQTTSHEQIAVTTKKELSRLFEISRQMELLVQHQETKRKGKSSGTTL